MFAIGNEPLIDANDVAKIVGCHPKTVYVWMRPYDSAGNPKPYLESTKIGGKKKTTVSAVNRFQRPAEYQSPLPQQSRFTKRHEIAKKQFDERIGG